MKPHPPEGVNEQSANDDSHSDEKRNAEPISEESQSEGSPGEEARDEEARKDETTNDEADSVISRLEAELEQALARNKELEDRHLRLRAEFDNFRRRTRQEAEELRKWAAGELAASLLPVIDNLELATQATEEGQGVPKSFISGLEMIYKQLLNELGKAGLQRIEAMGAPFDPNLHEAVIHEETDEHPDGHVIEELRAGYIFGERVIRASMVKVAKGS